MKKSTKKLIRCELCGKQVPRRGWAHKRCKECSANLKRQIKNLILLSKKEIKCVICEQTITGHMKAKFKYCSLKCKKEGRKKVNKKYYDKNHSVRNASIN